MVEPRFKKAMEEKDANAGSECCGGKQTCRACTTQPNIISAKELSKENSGPEPDCTHPEIKESGLCVLTDGTCSCMAV